MDRNVLKQETQPASLETNETNSENNLLCITAVPKATQQILMSTCSSAPHFSTANDNCQPYSWQLRYTTSSPSFSAKSVAQVKSVVTKKLLKACSSQSRHHDVKGSTNLCFSLSQPSLFAVQRITYKTFLRTDKKKKRDTSGARTRLKFGRVGERENDKSDVR